MTELDVQSASDQLGFLLPKTFSAPMISAGDLSAVGMNPDFEGGVCTTVDDLVGTQEAAVEAALCVHEEMVEWWDEYFAIAQDGGGGYYLMRRDESPEVYLMDSDWCEEPRVVSPNLTAFLEEVKGGEYPD
ncbi:SMI1/KNR4 family protein [Blastopirellula sp. JC732]|uniref:SMI1/KNR4 family protein n=1 Tax=Blastopirellula sediminis TaxID=2894196 RepID=A0A9X1MT10_9BACT|nr:SMI1/KNR4 family protein [Blastopirellula sediminis]MCC9604749.1 SMI1/KNR4 family protein [Blastopirellula sediminis]MCC9631952.1 SMI1/KNR4 family protein [Blastopirellula sediminis]